jgi:photosystem II stability/assembly factor-like uncharacterized protein
MGIGLLLVACALCTTSAAAGNPASLPRSALVPDAIAFFTASRGLLATGELPCSNGAAHCRVTGTIQRTTNGGRTWRIILRTPRPVSSVSIDRQGQWARFDDGETLHSTNGGRTWAPSIPETPEATPCPPKLDVYIHQVVATAHLARRPPLALIAYAREM